MIQLQWLWWSPLIALACLLWSCASGLPDGKLHVYVLDVGQGDALLIRSPDGKFILIDGGPDDEVLRQLGKVMPWYGHTLDLIIMTHPHSDHINGLLDVLQRYQVRNVMMTGVQYRSSQYELLLDQIARHDIPVLFVGNADQDYRLGNLIFDILFPEASWQGQSFENLNNSSIVFRLVYGNSIFYFSGDAEVEEERRILEAVKSHGLRLQSHFLKAGHHGSRTSNSPELLDHIQPSYAAISSGVGNRFGHPHPQTLKHLQERGVTVYRTGLDGIVEAVSDGQALHVKPWGKSN